MTTVDAQVVDVRAHEHSLTLSSHFSHTPNISESDVAPHGCVHRLDIGAVTTCDFAFPSSVRGDRRGDAASPEWIRGFGTEAISSASRGPRPLFVPGAPCRGFVIMPAYRPKLSQIRSDESPLSRGPNCSMCFGRTVEIPYAPTANTESAPKTEEVTARGSVV